VHAHTTKPISEWILKDVADMLNCFICESKVIGILPIQCFKIMLWMLFKEGNSWCTQRLVEDNRKDKVQRAHTAQKAHPTGELIVVEKNCVELIVVA